jgi:formyl-CoA transferase
VRAGVAISDLTAGSLLAFGVMMALYERVRTGKGRWIHTSLLESQIFLLDFQATRWLIDGEVAGQAGNDHPVSIPMGVFPASDGMINLAASSARLWERFCDTIDHPDWKTKPGWETLQSRAKNREAINLAIAEVTRLKPVAYWVEKLDEVGIPCGPINSIDQVFADPQVQHLGMAAPVAHPKLGDIKLVNSALNVEGLDRVIHRPTPEAGADTLSVLKSLGYSEAEIEGLRSKGAI